RYAKLARCSRDEADETEVLLYNPCIVDVLWRLRAHQAIAVATIGCENDIVRRIDSVQAPDIPSSEIQLQHIAASDMLEVLRRVNYSRHPALQMLQAFAAF